MLSSYTLNIDFYLPIGTPNGVDSLKYSTGITVAPQFLNVTPSIGSPAGSLITASVRGVGPNTSGVTLVNQAGVNICSNVTIPTYGIVICQTNPGVVSQ